MILLLVAFAALSASPVASAKSGYFTFPAERFSRLTAKGTHGFRISIDRHAGRVELSASNGSTSAIYIVRSKKLPRDQIQATFPGLGRVSVHFHPSSRVQRSPAFCGGRAAIRQNGVFEGVIRFEGERGFTRIDIEHARGFAFRSFKEVCKRSGPSNAATIPSYWLTATARSHGKTIAFAATKSADVFDQDGSATYFASQRERRHGVLNVRVAVAQGDRDTFAISGLPSQPDSAMVTPLSSPFAGTASFQASPGALAKWEGTLAVELPGDGAVPLTGSQFKSELCRGQRCVGGPPPEGKVPFGRGSTMVRKIERSG